MLNYICNLNISQYKNILFNIIKKEIIITNKQIEHINEKHPGVYEKYKNNLKDIIYSPDYIFKDNRENTYIFIKKYKHNIELVLKLNTDINSEYKNSIITMWEIKDKRLESYLKTRKVVYKRDN